MDIKSKEKQYFYQDKDGNILSLADIYYKIEKRSKAITRISEHCKEINISKIYINVSINLYTELCNKKFIKRSDYEGGRDVLIGTAILGIGEELEGYKYKLVDQDRSLIDGEESFQCCYISKIDYEQESNTKTFICSANMMHNDTLFCVTVGNSLPEDNKDYNPCLELQCPSAKVANLLYCKKFKLYADKKDLKDSSNEGFKVINFDDCEVNLL